MARDELAGWLDGIAEYKGGKGSDTGHWLACWSGVPLTVDRKLGAEDAPYPAGGRQHRRRDSAGRAQARNRSGTFAGRSLRRLLLAMPEPTPVRWTDAIVDPLIEAALGNVFDRLLAREPAADEDGHSAPFLMPLTPEAKAAWVEYYNRHRAESADLDDDLAAAWSKLEAYAARFALIFQLCQWAETVYGYVVEQRSMEAAIQLSDWFGGEAKRVYELFGESAEDREQRESSRRSNGWAAAPRSVVDPFRPTVSKGGRRTPHLAR